MGNESLPAAVSEPFTLIWRYTLDGIARERVIEADQVHVAYNNRGHVGDPNEPPLAMLGVYSVPSSGLVVIGDPSDGAKSMAFAYGTIYVMNVHGKTVASYKLAAPDPRLVTGIAASSEAAGGIAKTTDELAWEAGKQFDRATTR